MRSEQCEGPGSYTAFDAVAILDQRNLQEVTVFRFYREGWQAATRLSERKIPPSVRATVAADLRPIIQIEDDVRGVGMLRL